MGNCNTIVSAYTIGTYYSIALTHHIICTTSIQFYKFYTQLSSALKKFIS